MNERLLTPTEVAGLQSSFEGGQFLIIAILIAQFLPKTWKPQGTHLPTTLGDQFTRQPPL